MRNHLSERLHFTSTTDALVLALRSARDPIIIRGIKSMLYQMAAEYMRYSGPEVPPVGLEEAVNGGRMWPEVAFARAAMAGEVEIMTRLHEKWGFTKFTLTPPDVYGPGTDDPAETLWFGSKFLLIVAFDAGVDSINTRIVQWFTGRNFFTPGEPVPGPADLPEDIWTMVDHCVSHKRGNEYAALVCLWALADRLHIYEVQRILLAAERGKFLGIIQWARNWIMLNQD